MDVTIRQVNRFAAADRQEGIEAEFGDCVRIMIAIPAAYSWMNDSTVAVMKRLWQRSRDTVNPGG